MVFLLVADIVGFDIDWYLGDAPTTVNVTVDIRVFAERTLNR